MPAESKPPLFVSSPASAGMLLRSPALKIAAIYGVFGMLWIFFSDRVLSFLVFDSDQFVVWNSYKGFGFVAITAFLLFLLLRYAFGVIGAAYVSLRSVEQQLRTEKEFTDTMVESMPSILFFYDMQGRFLRWNHNFQAVSGYSAVEIVRMHPRDFFTGEDKTLVENKIQETFAQGKAFVEAGFTAKDGTVTPYFFTGRSIVYEGKPCLVGTGVDISAHKRSEEMLREKERDQRRLVEQLEEERSRLVTAQRVAKVGSWETDVATGIVTWSQEAYRIFETDPRTFKPTHERFLKLVHPEDRVRVDEALIQSIHNRSVNRIEHRVLMLDGRIKFVEERWQIFHDEKDQPIRAVGTCHDITERKTTEARLAESQERYRKLFDCAPDGIVISDPQSRYLDANPSMCRMLGYSYDEFVGLRAADIIDASQASMIASTMDEILKDNEHHRDWRFRRKDGTILEAEVMATLMPDGNVLGMIRDISERRQAEAEREKRFRAEAADRVKSAFLATMSHELRTPLNSIIGFTGILLQGLTGPLNTEQNKQLEMVRASARHLLELVNDVLDISKIEAGQLEVILEPFDMNRSIKKVLSLVGPQAAAKQIEMHMELSPRLDEAVGDERRFEQILLNLFSNAIKFTERGRIILKTEVVDQAKLRASETPQTVVRVSISDTGIGIRADDLKTLFQPFRQLDSGLARNFEGTGLGLAICGRLAGLMGGEITAESEWHRGSTFTVSLPLKGFSK